MFLADIDFIQFYEQVLIDIGQGGWVSYTVWLSLLIYPLLFIFLTIGFLINKKTKELLIPVKKVTVLVSARNEEKDLPSCIESLLKLDYPKDLLQIILVNDRSNDGTEKLVNDYASKNEHVLALHTENMPQTHLEAKARGVSCGMKHATGDWVFITDADAEVHPKWLRKSLSAADENTGMIGGTVVVKPTGFQGKLERTTWALAQMFNIGMSGWGVPFICVGPNIAIRRDIYENAGGLEKAEFYIAEDLALYNIVAQSNSNIITPVAPETTVELKQVPSFRHYLSQLRRWFRGGVENGSEYRFLLYAAIWFGFFIATFPFYGWVFSWNIYFALLGLQILTDIFILQVQKNRLGLKKHVIYLPFFFLTKIIALTYIPLSFLFTKKIQWMGDDYKVDYE
jgi:cellulose synthase/poly-beta-1,6-N-acetylglucosamine synthase-like glycosyltransferase